MNPSVANATFPPELEAGDPALSHLSDEQRARLSEVLDQYLVGLVEGTPPDAATLQAEHPDLADEIAAYVESIKVLHEFAEDFAGTSEASNASVPNERRRSVGEFELLREIGRGGMGVVYEAWQPQLERMVAVKLLPFAAMLDGRQISRFRAEARAAAQIQHPNIVPVYAVGMDHGIHYYAMQLVDGQPLDRAIEMLQSVRSQQVLVGSWQETITGRARQNSVLRFERELLDRSPTLSESSHVSLLTSTADSTQTHCQTALKLMIQAAEAIQAAHEYGVVHRDIKPSNLLLEPGGKLWVTDFGLARFQHDAGLTKTGDIVGTMRYMSPEQAAGNGALVDHRSDIYSLGATLYELVCLRPAFPQSRGPELLEKIATAEPVRPSKIRSGIPRDLESVILRAMAKSRDERYATAQELADDLRRVLEGKPTLARPVTLADRAMKSIRRHRRAVFLGVIAVFMAAVGMTISTLLVAREKAKAEANYARSQQLFRDSREVLDRFGVQLAEELAHVPGADDVRQQLLRETFRYYRDFLKDADDDPALRSDMALTYSRLGTLLGELGAEEEALAAHRKSWQLFETLAHETGRPNFVNFQAVSGNNLAEALLRQGKLEEARHFFQTSIALHADDTNQAPDLADEASAYSNLGLLEIEAGNIEAARAAFHQAIELLSSLRNQQPENQLVDRHLAAALNNLASTYLNTRPAEAAKIHRQALALQSALMKAAPSDSRFRRDLALTLNNLGAALLRTDQTEGAVAQYRRALEIQAALVQELPSQPALRNDLAVTRNNLGLGYSRLGEMTDAETAFRAALADYETLLADAPRNLAARSSLGGVFNNLGMVFERAEDYSAAAGAYQSAILHQRQAVEAGPDVARFRKFLDTHHANQRRVLQHLNGSVDTTMDDLPELSSLLRKRN